jgi:hypothetical protein
LEEVINQADDLRYDPWVPKVDEDQPDYLDTTGLTDDDMARLQRNWEKIQEYKNLEPFDIVSTMGMEGVDYLDNETLEEIEECLDEIGGSSYNVSRYLLYDLDFNVTNLILAACQHNPRAPIIFQHWYPQLVCCKRYEYARERNFDFTWEDVAAADITELKRYYKGMGYDEIPKKAPSETGIIRLEELDEEEIRMASFERWMTDVYNPESDRKDFDDDDMRDEDNVFSKFYVEPQHPDLPNYEDSVEDIRLWHEELGEDLTEEEIEYRDMMGREVKYKVVHDPEFEELFRGHLVVACTPDDQDLEIAEKITSQMEKNFGKQIFVETRVITHARQEDNVFEVWLESYDVELLHSKKRATTGAKGWTGPPDCDDAQIEHLVDKVGFLISDENRYSYRYESEGF